MKFRLPFVSRARREREMAALKLKADIAYEIEASINEATWLFKEFRTWGQNPNQPLQRLWGNAAGMYQAIEEELAAMKKMSSRINDRL